MRWFEDPSENTVILGVSAWRDAASVTGRAITVDDGMTLL